ncbi:MAG: (d)CMP kinase [Oscillospiraceae bacterium]
MAHFSIAIDGPSGAGKSTLAKALAEARGYLYVDTGAIYRTLGLYAVQKGIAPTDHEGVFGLLDSVQIALEHGADGLQHMLLCGEDVTEKIRENAISAAASAVSAYPEVRAFLMDTQRRLAEENNVVMDGRDIGTVVLPNANVKIFLTAVPEARARRRYEELLQRGQQVDYDTVLRDLNQRDYNDTHRATAPLKQGDDAILVDTTDLTLDESLAALQKAVEGRLGE